MDAVTSLAESQVAATTSYVAPAFVTAEPVLRESMRRLVSRTANRAVEPVEEALDGCRSVEVWPFNRSHHAARDAQVAYLRAERDRLLAIGRNGAAFDNGYGEIQRLADQAEASLRQ